MLFKRAVFVVLLGVVVSFPVPQAKQDYGIKEPEKVVLPVIQNRIKVTQKDNKTLNKVPVVTEIPSRLYKTPVKDDSFTEGPKQTSAQRPDQEPAQLPDNDQLSLNRLDQEQFHVQLPVQEQLSVQNPGHEQFPIQHLDEEQFSVQHLGQEKIHTQRIYQEHVPVQYSDQEQILTQHPNQKEFSKKVIDSQQHPNNNNLEQKTSLDRLPSQDSVSEQSLSRKTSSEKSYKDIRGNSLQLDFALEKRQDQPPEHLLERKHTYEEPLQEAFPDLVLQPKQQQSSENQDQDVPSSHSSIPVSPMDGMPYNFEWSVADKENLNIYNHVETSNGVITSGEYSVLLPDGKMQVVTFTDRGKGYEATVTYTDYAKL